MLDRRLLWLAPLTPMLIVVPALIGLLGPLRWFGLYVVFPVMLISTGALCAWTVHFVWRSVRTALRLGGMVCGSCGHILRGGSIAVCPECGAARPSDSDLRLAWWRWAPLLRPLRYVRWKHAGRLRRRLLGRSARCR